MNRFYNFIFSLALPLCAVFYPRRTKLLSPLPDGAAIVCANHSNYIDPFLIALTVGREHQLHYMAKEELGKNPLLRGFLNRMGAFFVSRGKNDLGAIKTAIGLLRKGEKVGIFPEGTRVGEDDAVAAKNGAVRLAMRLHVPLVPVFITRNKKLFRKLDVVVGEPYMIEADADMQTQTEELMRRIRALDPARQCV